MTQNFNPLLDFARKVECSVKIPSNGGWYDDDNITFNAINEIDIKPMLPNDEMTIVNPETLISGDSIIEIIKSCCPGINNPSELYYPDVNAILLGIKKATYGDELTQQYICPVCWSKKNDVISKELVRLIKEKYPNGDVELSVEESQELEKIAEENTKEEITLMERRNEICITPQELKCSIEKILADMTFLPKDGIVELKNGLKVYTTPYRCIDKIKFINKQIKYQKIAKYLQDNAQKFKNTYELTNEYVDAIKGISDMYKDVTEITIDIIASSIKKIETPTGDVVSNHMYIWEFLKNADVDSVKMIRENIDRLNECGVQSTIPCECQCCGHKWDEKFYGFNQNDFFGISS